MSILRANTHPGMHVLFCSFLPGAVLFDVKYNFVSFSYKCSFSEKILISLAVHSTLKFCFFSTLKKWEGEM